MLIVLLLVALLLPDIADAACPASRNRGGGGGGKQTAVRRPKMIVVPKRAERSVTCPSRPRESCEVASSSTIVVRDEADDSKDRLVWRWRGTTKATDLQIGDPVQETAFGLCVYDSFEGHRFLLTSLRIEPGASWSHRKSGAWHYRSTGQSPGGVTRVAARTSVSGKTRVGLKARGKRLPLPQEPATREKLYHKDRDVLVQLVTSANDQCWTSTFATAAENSTVSFVAPGSGNGSTVLAGTR